MINHKWLELPMSRTNFLGPKDVQAIEVNCIVFFSEKGRRSSRCVFKNGTKNYRGKFLSPFIPNLFITLFIIAHVLGICRQQRARSVCESVQFTYAPKMTFLILQHMYIFVWASNDCYSYFYLFFFFFAQLTLSMLGKKFQQVRF